MLIQFNIKNFRSFRDEVSLDLTATKITEHTEHVVDLGNEKLLPVSVVFGANASGKSNVYKAFEFMSYYVIESFSFGDKKAKKNEDVLIYKTTPFLFDNDKKDAPSTFEVFFIDKDDTYERTYQYGFMLDQTQVLEEWLNVKSKSSKSYQTLLYRENNKITCYGSLQKYKENIELSIEKECLVASLGAKLKISLLKKLRDWFYNNDCIDFGDPCENFIRSNLLPTEFAVNKQIQNEVITYFNSFDTSIKSFKVQKKEKLKTNEKSSYSIDTMHQNVYSNESISIPLSEESSGTLKMFTLFEPLKSAIENGSVLFVDELNARLHPLLVRNIILTFLNTDINVHNAQLVFTTHDAWQLSSNLLRRDEIWFTEKDETGISSLYSLAEFVDENGDKIRKDENFEKNYLLGKYGAIPQLTGLDVFKEV
jgi:AAA15 family ATPase/GTPase